jgi:hypothetical protein
VFGFQSGDFELLQWEESEKELYRIQTDKVNEHEEPLETVDVLHDQGLILTSSADGRVKVWNACKELIREIKFNEEIKEAVFLNDQADIVIAHGG